MERIIHTRPQSEIDEAIAALEAEGMSNTEAVANVSPVLVTQISSEAIEKGFTLDDVMAKLPDTHTNVRKTPVENLPQDRMFRGAWTDANVGETVVADLDDAKIISHGMRRKDREAKLTPLDKEVTFAGTSSSRKTAINVERNAILSDNATIQTGIDTANDEAALRSVLSKAVMI